MRRGKSANNPSSQMDRLVYSTSPFSEANFRCSVFLLKEKKNRGHCITTAFWQKQRNTWPLNEGKKWGRDICNICENALSVIISSFVRVMRGNLCVNAGENQVPPSGENEKKGTFWSLWRKAIQALSSHFQRLEMKLLYLFVSRSNLSQQNETN